jgi:triphosphoribosyl-dephospho-CoA synthase
MIGVETAASMPRSVTPAEVAAAAQLACLLEVSAPKPGNVSPGRHFVDIRYEDFLASAVAIGGPLAGVGTRPLGTTIRLAIEATARWTRSNTNLGIVLMLTPLARAALEIRQHAESAPWGFAEWQSNGLREAVRRVLDGTTVDDAREVYAAIRLAAPGGLGRVKDQDVASDPDVTLVEAMRLAAHRDGVAREYATAFETTFEAGVPTLVRARRDGLTWEDAIVETFLHLLATGPDTHVARRAGAAAAEAVQQHAVRVLAAGGVRSANGRRALDEMDRALRDARNSGNPGTTADLTAAAIFVVLLGCGFGPDPHGGDHAAGR